MVKNDPNAAAHLAPKARESPNQIAKIMLGSFLGAPPQEHNLLHLQLGIN
jgi:hypothetical protein